ncbi:MAG: uroporphyrinogen decarboxylase family protein [Desulfobacterales bacterium]|nr:uroporphyrinogen decarboxylase family protein [Desulfobacterales bacterium]
MAPLTLTPKERVMRTFRREPIDTMAFFSGMGMVVMPAIRKLGYRFSQVHKDAEKMARSAIESSRMFGFDSVVIPFDMTMESEAIGNTISLYENSKDILYPTIPQKMWLTMDQVNIPSNIMELGRLPLLPKAIGIIKKEAPELPIGVWQLGPFTQAGQVLELDILLKGVFKEKAKVEATLDKLTEMCITIGQALQAAGADYITLREMGTGTDLLSPRTWKDVIQPRMRKILASWKSPKVLHICGATDMIIEMMADCGADAVSVDIKNNLLETRKKLGDRVPIFGNFDVFALPCKEETTVEQAVAAIKKNIDGGVDAVWPGCDLWPDIKEANMRAIVQTAREYGSKPSACVGRL